MAYRQYSIKGGGNENTVPVSVNGTRKYVTFRKSGWDNADATYDTQDEEVALAIETSDLYRRGLITCHGDTIPLSEERTKEPEGAEEPREYPDVTTVAEAKKILSADFGIPYSRMPNAEETKRVASEYGVHFPGLG